MTATVAPAPTPTPDHDQPRRTPAEVLALVESRRLARPPVRPSHAPHGHPAGDAARSVQARRSRRLTVSALLVALALLAAFALGDAPRESWTVAAPLLGWITTALVGMWWDLCEWGQL